MKDFHKLAREYCEWATNAPHGRPRGDAVVTEVTEGRDVPGAGPYSSCGDLCHGMLEHIGVRLPWVNRDSLGGWRSGLNISLLFPKVWAPDPNTLYVKTDDYSPDWLAPGDVLLMCQTGADGRISREHVCVFDRTLGQRLATFDYGQPGGKYYDRIDRDWNVLGGRKVRWVLPLAHVVDAADEAGRLV